MTNETKQDLVQVHRDGAVAVVTMNDPARRNPFSHAMRLALTAAFQRLMDEEPEVRAIVLTGAGGHFCAGGDLSEMKTATPSMLALRERISVAARLVKIIIGGAKPVIAAVEGSCMGAGLSLAAACDLAVGARDSRYECSFVRIGLLPDTGLMWTLAQKVGAAQARRMMLLPSRIDAQEAARIGLLNGVAEPGAALEQALAQARQLAALPPTALTLMKGALVNGAVDIETAKRHETDLDPLARTTPDHQEAVAAFAAGRPPQFRGE